jgi:hypothetical protein
MRRAPTYKVGDYLIIYCGRNEGCCFTVKGVRWSFGAGWEYDTGAYGWRPENSISTEGFARMFP